MKCVIDPNLSKKSAGQTARLVCERLHDLHAEIRMSRELESEYADLENVRFLPAEEVLEGADFVIAIGGDGTILRSAGWILDDAAARTCEPVKLVGINTGTLGFLAAFEASELNMLDRLSSGDYAITRRMMLKTEICGGTQDGAVKHVLNDIYASRLNGRICDFAVSVDGRQIGVYRADGIIFSTPTGSSAYALSAGGPVMEPDLSLIEMNLICPHSLFARPMLFAPQRSIRVTYRGAGDGGLNVHADGVHAAVLHNAQSFTVTCSERYMPFVDCKGSAFYDAPNGKLMRPLKEMQE
ncbi:MAG: NAD(+)/NADH kinase [Oscillospiraceae bacterium]|nr:NAD(+)/NADH kinase [Oscillospiraceae bacterium]